MTKVHKKQFKSKFSANESVLGVPQETGNAGEVTSSPISRKVDQLNSTVPLKHIFRKNALGYKLLVRNSKLALFALSTDRHWEISRIYIIPAGERFGRHYPETETISDNDQFGLDGSRAFGNRKKAIEYFKDFSKKLGEKDNDQFPQLENVDNSGSINAETYPPTTEGEIVPPTKKLSAYGSNISDVVEVDESFCKSGLMYKLIQRNKYVCLYGIYSHGNPVGFEVMRLQTLPEFTSPQGKYYPPREAPPKDDQFGTDGSRSFLSGESERALKYFKNLTAEIISIKNGSNEHYYTNG